MPFLSRMRNESEAIISQSWNTQGDNRIKPILDNTFEFKKKHTVLKEYARNVSRKRQNERLSSATLVVKGTEWYFLLNKFKYQPNQCNYIRRHWLWKACRALNSIQEVGATAESPQDTVFSPIFLQSAVAEECPTYTTPSS